MAGCRTSLESSTALSKPQLTLGRNISKQLFRAAGEAARTSPGGVFCTARKGFPTRLFCGSGGRGVEGLLSLREIPVWPRGAATSLSLLAAKEVPRLLAGLVARDDTQKLRGS